MKQLFYAPQKLFKQSKHASPFRFLYGTLGALLFLFPLCAMEDKDKQNKIFFYDSKKSFKLLANQHRQTSHELENGNLIITEYINKELIIQEIDKALDAYNFNAIPNLLKKIGVGNITEKRREDGQNLLNKALLMHNQECYLVDLQKCFIKNCNRCSTPKKTPNINNKKALEEIIDLFMYYKVIPYFYGPNGRLPYEIACTGMIHNQVYVEHDNQMRNKYLDAMFNSLNESKIAKTVSFLLSCKCMKYRKLPKPLQLLIIKMAFMPQDKDMQDFKEAIETIKSKKKTGYDRRITDFLSKWGVYNPPTRTTSYLD